MEPEDWPEVLKAQYGDVLSDPAAWARKCVDFGADLICLRLISAHPDQKDTSPEAAAATARAVAEAVNVPLVVLGSGFEEKDAALLAAVSEALAGKNVLIGCATPENYKTITASCMVHGHSVIASSPLDINLAKQLNILINEMNLPLNRIAIDPLVGPLGYGLEYAYSIMERARIGALTGDKMLAMPVICFIGSETWKTKEAKTEYNQEWGEQARRAVLWESLTAVSFVQAGGAILILRHPESLKHCKKHIAAMTGAAE
jgi:acetyl-CoA decarbonylase/synthase complex subunit delta